MPVLQDRVQETTTTGGTGTLTLAGAVIGYRSFNSAFTIGDITYYTIDNGAGEWEIGVGTVGSGTLSRTTVLESSNANALVNFSAGTKRVFCSAPTKVLLPNQTGNSGKVLSTDGVDPAWTTTLNGVTIGNITPAAGAFTTLSASSTVSGTGFSTYLASPPAIGGTTPAAGNFTTLGATGNVTLGDAAGDTLTINGAAVSTPNNLNFDSNTLFIDAANNRVGIGTSSPQSKLSVQDSWLSSMASSGGVQDVPVITNYIAGNLKRGSINFGVSLGGGTYYSFYIGSTTTPPEVMRIDSYGNLLLRQAFNAANTSVRFNTTVQNALTLDASGNLGVGTNSPSGGKVVIQSATVDAGDSTALRIVQSNLSVGATVLVKMGTEGAPWSKGAIGFKRTGDYDVGAIIFCANSDAMSNADVTSSDERARIDFSGNFGLGTTTFGTSAATVLGIRTGTAPSTGPADTIQLYSTDLSAGNTILSLFTEGTPVNANTTAAATHRIAIRINGTVYYLLANTAA